MVEVDVVGLIDVVGLRNHQALPGGKEVTGGRNGRGVYSSTYEYDITCDSCCYMEDRR